MKSPSGIVITATVTPAKGMIGSVRNDPSSRLREYCEAFQFYLDLPDHCVDTVVLLENSDADLAIFRELASRRNSQKRIFLISTSSNYPGHKGKGYGEFLMIDEGLSQLARNDKLKGKSFWKITGRLKVLNLQKLIEEAPIGCEIYCDLRDVPLIGNKLGGNKWMELRLFSFTMAGYDKYFRGKYDLGIGLEFYFFDIVRSALESSPGVAPRFISQPIFDGFCGYNNKSYSSLEYRLKTFVRRFFRLCFPRVWL